MTQQGAEFRVWIDGEEEKRLAGHVLRVEVEENTDEMSSFCLEVDMAPVKDDWDRLADKRFDLLRRVTIAFVVGPPAGGERKEAVLFDGYVTMMEPSFSRDRVPHSTLKLSGLDAACLMHLGTRTRPWHGKTDTEIAKAIYEEYGFAVPAEAFDDTAATRQEPRASLIQRGTDAEFIRHLARRNGYEAYVERRDAAVTATEKLTNVAGHFRLPKPDLDPQEALTMFPSSTPSVIEMDVRWESHRPTVVKSAHIDLFSRRVKSTAVDTPEPRYHREGGESRHELLARRLAEVLPNREFPEDSRPEEERAAEPIQSVGLQYASTPHDEEEVERLAWSQFRDADWFAEASVLVDGLRYPEILRARRPIDLGGAGKRLDGRWYVRRARHEIVWAAKTHRYQVDVSMVRNTVGVVS